ncbi:glycosyltransferase [Cohnella abietis]|uniref:Glycosyl transferase n=1 Tax=Cohnella abietis TaxID=2507935 RepID=A0A3T1D172_9BACL|nr:glycosyltransferase [Cohnella abietis]BBI31808.1 hypothetical protein KCTCHS21_12070 [Cohnella abietis]
MESKEKPLNIMFVSHTYIGGSFVVGSHHLARELLSLGHRVLHLSTSITPIHLLQMKKKSVSDRFKQWININKQDKNDQIIHCVPFSWVPWKLAGRIFQKTGINWFVRCIAFPSVTRMLANHRFTEVDLLLIDQPYFVGIERYIKAKVIVYRPTDNYKDILDDQTVESAEKEIVSRAHGIVATSDPVFQNIQKYKPELPGIVMENGVEFEHFSTAGAEPEELMHIPWPRAIYIGAVDNRLDMEAIKQLAEARKDLSIIVIGPHLPSSSLSTSPNVHMLGAKPYSQLPAFLHHATLALLPMSNHAANAGRSPMKLYEYAAAGLPTVVTATPELLRRTDHFLYFYKDKQEFIAQVNDVLKKLANNEISKSKIIHEARKQSWEAKAEQLLAFGSSLGG